MGKRKSLPDNGSAYQLKINRLLIKTSYADLTAAKIGLTSVINGVSFAYNAWIPDILITCPVSQEDLSDARKGIASAMSCFSLGF